MVPNRSAQFFLLPHFLESQRSFPSENLKYKHINISWFGFTFPDPRREHFPFGFFCFPLLDFEPDRGTTEEIAVEDVLPPKRPEEKLPWPLLAKLLFSFSLCTIKVRTIFLSLLNLFYDILFNIDLIFVSAIQCLSMKFV